MIVEMTLEHALYVCRNIKKLSYDSMEGTRFTYDPQEFAISRFMTDGLKLTCLAKDGTPVGIGGLQLTHPKVWTAWVIGTERWNECSREIIWKCRKTIKSMMAKEDACHRIQATCLSDDPGARRYLELVGLEWEDDKKRMRKDGGSMSFYSVVSP